MTETTELSIPAKIFAEDLLPSLPSALLSAAVSDARKTIRSSLNVSFSMSQWFVRKDGNCEVCLGGNMLLRRYEQLPETLALEVGPYGASVISPGKKKQAINETLRCKLSILDVLRRGAFPMAICYMSESKLITDVMAEAIAKLHRDGKTKTVAVLAESLMGVCPAPLPQLQTYLEALEVLAGELQAVGC